MKTGTILKGNSYFDSNVQCQQSGICSPKDDNIMLNSGTQKRISDALNGKLMGFLSSNNAKSVCKKFKKERGRNIAIDYKKEYDFREQWEQLGKPVFALNYNYLFPQNFPLRICNLVILLLLIFQVWILSVFRLFKCQENNWIFWYCLVIQLLELGLKILLIANFIRDSKIKDEHKKIKMRKYIQTFGTNLFCLFYAILGLGGVISSTEDTQLIILDIVCILFCYLSCEEVYRNLKMWVACSKYKPYMNIFDLMSNLFLLTHLFALLIFSMSIFETGQDYLTKIEEKLELNWFSKYIYSIYFASTTMLTVGYGDILPVNIKQILMILVMQLFGIVMIGYINGQVGDVLCKLRIQRQNLQNDLTSSDRMSKSYRLSLETTQKIRQYLINNGRASQELNFQKENQLLNKISGELRQEANYTNHINLIKESIFFVYNFSKKIQNQVSNKLERLVLSPNQSLPQISGKQKIYLLSKGQLSLYIRHGSRNVTNSRKVLRTISKSPDKDVHDNAYGYTSLILGRPTKIKAFAKDFAICHTLSRQDFLDSLLSDSGDFECFHQIKTRFQTTQCPERWEAPEFSSIRSHYQPNNMFVIKKHLKRSKITSRRQVIRQRGRTRMVYEKEDEIQKNENIDFDQSLDSSMTSISQSNVKSLSINNICLNEKERQMKYKASNILISAFNIHSRGYSQKYCNKKYQEKRQELVSQLNKSNWEEPFQSCKQYNNFFRAGNLTNIIRKANYQNNSIDFVSSFLEFLPPFRQEKRFDSRSEIKALRQKQLMKSTPF